MFREWQGDFKFQIWEARREIWTWIEGDMRWKETSSPQRRGDSPFGDGHVSKSVLGEVQEILQSQVERDLEAARTLAHALRFN